MRSRGRLALAVVTAAGLVAAGLALERSEPSARPGVASMSPSDGAWFCPHGGGDGWATTLYVANPGTAEVRLRVTPLATRRADEPSSYTVAPGSELAIDTASGDEAASSYVEYFGGWVAAGWVSDAGGGESGVAAEPCSPEPSARWLAADGTTEQGEDASIVVMNPFDVDAVVDVTVLSERRAPIRESDLTNLRVGAHHSRIVRLNAVSADEPAAAAEVLAHAGRVAVASLGVSRDGGIRSALAVAAPSTEVVLAGTNDVGQSTLAVMAPGTEEIRFGATLLSQQRPEAAGGLDAAAQTGGSARAYPLITDGPSVIDILAAPDSPPFAAVRRSEGSNGDPGATAGGDPASAWIVLPTVGGAPNAPGLVLGNTGAAPVQVALTLLGADGAIDETSVSVPPTSAVGVPAGFLQREPTAAVLAVSTDGTFVATGASSSLGREGVAAYAVAAGVPIPAAAAVTGA